MEVTLQDIAEATDVSPATVSRSLRHDKLIHPETRARVIEVARRMGYQQRVRRPRRSAEKETRTTTLGLLLRANSLDATQGDINLTKMMAGIMAATDQQGVLFQVHTLRSPEEGNGTSRIPPMIEEGGCQALIAHGAHEAEDIAFLADRMPVVTMGRVYPNLPADGAVADNVGGVRELVTHLVQLGHRRLAWVGAHYESSFMEARQAGFIQGCLGHGLELDRHWFFGNELYIEREIRKIDVLQAAVASGVTAFVCGNDSIALAVTEALETVGLTVPAGVSVTGFDAWTQNHHSRRPTTVDPNFFEIGQVAARMAMQRIAHLGGQPCVVSVRGNIVPGDTTAPPR